MFTTRLRYPSLLALAISTWACSHKDIPAPAPAPNTCSYTLDGRPATGTAKAIRNPAYHLLDATGDHPAELLTITCTSTTASTASPLLFSLSFIKFLPESDAAFRPLPSPGIDVLRHNPATGSAYTNYTLGVNLTLKTTSTGGFSGTFGGEYPATATSPRSAFVAGVFTDVHP
ncbi:hypothetical protein QMK33_04350 [Hymenobacter sp. H14-R3]|uniref:hypothetical protein n=1 Tax=Hymenobacter sp. H14-R3 TaxID=3046308 RepID=UPI0024B99A3E|nr:hypothetical protein [Hymenobacter sp. H14-R3]MDJ0364371.1 hypothetical protein [Hymenobacter sp. H14-R3]